MLSRDHGVSWLNTKHEQDIYSSTPDPRRPGWLYLVVRHGAGGTLFRSQDWGGSWVVSPMPENFFTIEKIVFDADNENTMYAVDAGVAAISKNNGDDWEKMAGPLSAAAGAKKSCLNKPVNADPACLLYSIPPVNTDVFLAKLLPAGTMLWSTFLGGSPGEFPAILQVDAAGNAYVAGYTDSDDFYATSESAKKTPGQRALFSVKFSGSGELLYSTVLGAASSSITSLSVSQNSEAFLTGGIAAATLPLTPGLPRPTIDFRSRFGFAIKLNRTGTVAYATYLPNFPTIGTSASTPFEVPPNVVASLAENDGSLLLGGGFNQLMRLSADGSSLTAASPTLPGEVYVIATDAKGTVYVTGTVSGAGTFSKSCVALIFAHVGGIVYRPPGDIFVAKLTPDRTAIAAPTFRGLSDMAVGVSSDIIGRDRAEPLHCWRLSPGQPDRPRAQL